MHLILLIGTNPLPDYVVAEYLLSKKEEPQIDKIWLVHSEKRDEQAGTEETAKRLKTVVSARHPEISDKFEYCSLNDIGNAKKIKTDIEKTLLKDANKDNIHLNYTGGTKAMSVHVYRAIEQSDKFKGKTSFSYLDAREFVLKDDDKGIDSGDLRKEVSIPLEDLAKLHGYEKKREGKNYYWPPALEEFKKLIDESLLSEFLRWKKEVIRELYYDEKGDFIESRQKMQERLIKEKNLFDTHSFKPTVLPLLQTIPEEHSILDETGSLWIPDDSTTNKECMNRVKPAVKEFLDGKWLENYVRMILANNITTEFPDRTIPMESNWELSKPSGKEFELDVIVLNGYQVCGISCTTDANENLCKEKGFEVLHRVNQIGGEEAKAVLITCLSHKHKDGNMLVDKVERVGDDLRYETGGEDKLLVLGIEDLKEEILWKKIKKHIWG